MDKYLWVELYDIYRRHNMALQNNYKAVIDYTIIDSKSVHLNTVVVGRARDVSEVVCRIEEKFDPDSTGKVTIHSIECLGWETF